MVVWRARLEVIEFCCVIPIVLHVTKFEDDELLFSFFFTYVPGIGIQSIQNWDVSVL
jgi:hypothetical protein